MAQFSHTSDAIAFSLVDFPNLAVPPVSRAPINFISGGALVYTPEQPPGFVPQDEPAPAWGTYIYQAGTEQPPGGRPLTYYVPGEDYSLVGSLGDPAAIVQGTRTYAEIPIAELYALKRREVAVQDEAVRYNAVDTSLATNWWLVVTQAMRFELGGIQGNWLQRQIDGLNFPAGPNAPWVGIYNAATAAARRQQVTDAATWNTLYLELTQHDQATGNATDASLTALDAAYDDGAGSWESVADHDAADPAWGYPPTVSIPQEVLVFFGG